MYNSKLAHRRYRNKTNYKSLSTNQIQRGFRSGDLEYPRRKALERREPTISAQTYVATRPESNPVPINIEFQRRHYEVSLNVELYIFLFERRVANSLKSPKRQRGGVTQTA